MKINKAIKRIKKLNNRVLLEKSLNLSLKRKINKNNPKIFDRNKIPIEEDGKKNMKLHGDRVLNLLDSDFSILNGRIEKNTSKEYVYRNLGKLSIIFPEFSFFLNIYAKLYRMLMYKSMGAS